MHERIVPVELNRSCQSLQGLRCGTTTGAVLPANVPAGACGPHFQATVAVLSGRWRLSRREVVGVYTNVLGAPLAGLHVGRSRAAAGLLGAPQAGIPEAGGLGARAARSGATHRGARAAARGLGRPTGGFHAAAAVCRRAPV